MNKLRIPGWLIIAALVLASGGVVYIWGNQLLTTGWGSVLLNLISGFFFVVGIVIIFGISYRGSLRAAEDFFGIRRGLPLHIYVSTHEDPSTLTREVHTGIELQAADQLRHEVMRNFPASLGFWAERFGYEVPVPEIVVEGCPLGSVDNWPCEGSLILIGGPTRNSISEYVLRVCSPPLIFNDAKKVFLIRRASGTDYEPVANSRRHAILERMVVGDRVVIIAFGYGELETRAAITHLISGWKTFNRRQPPQGFAHLLIVQDERADVAEEIQGGG